jgi:copper chaperone
MMKKVTFKLETLTCPTCVTKIEKAVTKTKGVSEASVLFNSSKVKIEFNEELVSQQDLVRVIERVGYDVLSQQ